MIVQTPRPAECAVSDGPHVVFRDGLCVSRERLSCRDVFFCFQLAGLSVSRIFYRFFSWISKRNFVRNFEVMDTHSCTFGADRSHFCFDLAGYRFSQFFSPFFLGFWRKKTDKLMSVWIIFIYSDIYAPAVSSLIERPPFTPSPAPHLRRGPIIPPI